MPPSTAASGYNTEAHCSGAPRQQQQHRQSLRHCLPNIRRQLAHAKQEAERDVAWLARIASRRHERCRDRKPAPFIFNQLWDRLDFDYTFKHRKRLPQYPHTIRLNLTKLLEVINWKATFESRSGEPGFFNSWRDWTSHITPILFSGSDQAERIVWCRPGSGKKRCKCCDFCPLCLWLDKLRVLVLGFGSRSGSYNRAQAWYFITVGITANPANSRAKSKVYGAEEEEVEQTPGSSDFDPYPVLIDDRRDDVDTPQAYDDARMLAASMQAALDSLYKRGRTKRGLLDGYRSKIECAFRVRHPETRVNIHLHAIANGEETDGAYLAHEVLDELARLIDNEPTLRGRFFPDVLFEAIPSADLLESAFKYLEKLLPVSEIVEDAQLDPNAQRPDGSWSDTYMEDLDLALRDLLDDHLPNLLTGYQLDAGEGCTRRRKAAGNMVFTDDGCVGKEPVWHRRLRKKRKKARVRRTSVRPRLRRMT